MPKPTRRSTQRKANPPKKLVRVVARLAPAQAAALQREANRRKTERERGRSDVSEVIREAVSVWMAIRPTQRAIIRDVAAQHDLTRPEVLRQALDAWLSSLDPHT
jgi:hypothetical protein